MGNDGSKEADSGRTRMKSMDARGPVHVCGVEISNHVLLRVAAFSFLIFVVAEVVGALASNSLSLLGDAAAMSVDVFTYFCNMYSEHVKAKFGVVSLNTRMVLEVGIPMFSVTALVAVSAWITNDAILIILDPSDGPDVNVIFLFAFAAGNALIDVICSILFYLRRGDVLKTPRDKTSRLLQNQHHKDIEESVGNVEPSSFSSSSSSTKTETQSSSYTITVSNTNLNMASALTHVGGDTLRTGAVFVAAIVASVTDLNPTLCDAWAAVMVTITILFLVGPLLKEIAKAYSRLSKEKLRLTAENRESESTY